MTRLPLLLLTALLACAPQIRLPIVPGTMGAAAGGLFQPSNATLAGGFRIPVGADDQHSAHFGGKVIWVDPTTGTLLISGCECPGGLAPLMAEVSIPTLVNSSVIANLNTGSTLVPWVDPTGGRWTSISTGNNFIGGIYDCKAATCGTEKVLLNYYEYYGSDQALSTFVVVRSTLTYSAGAFLIGQPGGGSIGGARWTGGAMIDIPSALQTGLGGKVLTGFCCGSTINSTSFGPTATAFDPNSIATSPAGNLDLGYDQNHTTIGPWFSAGLSWNGGSPIWGMAFPSNTQTVMFAGTYGSRAACVPNGSFPPPFGNGCNQQTGFGYGVSTNVLAEDNTNCPGNTDTAHGCVYDPTVIRLSGPGVFMWPYLNQIWLYRQADLAATHAGTHPYYNPQPYGVWNPTFPVTGCSTTGNPCITGMTSVPSGVTLGGSAVCPCVLLAQANVDNNAPIIWVYTVSTPPAPEPLTPLLAWLQRPTRRL